MEAHVTVPSSNGYYDEPQRMDRVVEHMKQFDPNAELKPLEGEKGHYTLTCAIDRSFIIMNVLRIQYGFTVQ